MGSNLFVIFKLGCKLGSNLNLHYEVRMRWIDSNSRTGLTPT